MSEPTAPKPDLDVAESAEPSAVTKPAIADPGFAEAVSRMETAEAAFKTMATNYRDLQKVAVTFGAAAPVVLDARQLLAWFYGALAELAARRSAESLETAGAKTLHGQAWPASFKPPSASPQE